MAAATRQLVWMCAEISLTNPAVASPPTASDYAPRSRISFDDARAWRRHVAAAAADVAGVQVRWWAAAVAAA